MLAKTLRKFYIYHANIKKLYKKDFKKLDPKLTHSLSKTWFIETKIILDIYSYILPCCNRNNILHV